MGATGAAAARPESTWSPLGRSPHRDRRCDVAMTCRTGSPWRDVPAGHGPWKTVYSRHRLW
ncbi:transposase [Nocardioides sp.]|uniref:transposase n=1 Tax=Nocardioides sp. TaxID=35761 RepID=UPI0035279908